MANPIKYSASTQTQALKTGNFWFNTGDTGAGPTTTTGYYNGIDPPSGGYTVYIRNSSDLPSIYCPSSDAELIALTNKLAGTSYSTIGECLSYYSAQTDKACFNRNYESIITAGLVLNLDAGFTQSYPRSGTTWRDLSGNTNTGTLANGATFDSGYSGSIIFDGSNDSCSVADNSSLDFSGSVNLSCELWIKISTYKDISIVLGKGDGGGIGTAYNYYFIGTNVAFYFRISDGVSSQSSPNITSTIFPAGTWGHVVAVLDSSTIRIYFNGIEVGTATTRTINPLANNSPLYVSTPSYPINGNIAIARIYNRNLSATEVLRNYQAGFTRFLGENIVTNGLDLYLDAGYYYSYPGTGTIWFDASGNGYGTSMKNGAVYDSNDGGSISFDGIDDYIDIGNIILNNSNINNITIDIWIKFTNMNINGYFMSKGAVADGTTYTFSGWTGPGPSGSESSYVRFSFSNGTSTSTIIEFSNLLFNEYYNFVYTFDGSQVTGYMNGGDAQSQPLSGPLYYTNVPLYLGRSKYGNYMEGNISIFKIYNRAITPAEVLQNFNAQKSRYGY